jgi:hypothetical protein
MYEEYKQLVNYFVNKFAYNPDNMNENKEVLWDLVKYNVFFALLETVDANDELFEYLENENHNFENDLNAAIEKFKG